KYIETLVRTIENLRNIISALNENLTNYEKDIAILREQNADLKSKVPNVSNLEKLNEMYKIKIDELEREIKIYKKKEGVILDDSKKSVFNLQKKVIETKNQTQKEFVKKSEQPKIEILEVASEGRRKCPNCNNVNQASIHELVDKTKIVMDYPRVYSKKYKCGDCGMEWK
ncbi:MAG TPA: hypothetical protein VGB37_18205, partial [Candidatus Lokiarchaeia archaeon]